MADDWTLKMPWRWYVCVFLYEFFTTLFDLRTWVAALIVVLGVVALMV
jgi:hypothetical protein